MWKLFLLKQKGNGGWEEVSGFVIRAKNATQARHVASENAQAEGSVLWRNSEKSTCNVIGTARDEGVEVILRDLWEG